MLTKIQQFFQQHLLADDPDEDDLDSRLQLAAAALMVEIIYADETLTGEEENSLRELLKQRFSLAPREIENLVELAHAEKTSATDYYAFTSLINTHYTQQQKVKLVEDLWRLAYADGELDKFEEHLIRRLADLLHVPHRDFMRTKHKTMNEKL